jgi:UDP-glucose 4-epimerase
MTARHAVVVGGAGFVGGWTARAFLAAGWRVTVVDPVAALSGRVPEGCATVAKPVDAEVLASIVATDPPRVLVGLGAFGAGGKGLLAASDVDPGAAIAVNAGGLATLLQAAAGAGIRRVLWTSSTVVYGQTDTAGLPPADETLPADPDTAYGLSKTLAEITAEWFRTHRPVEATGVRLPLVLGPGLHYRGAAAQFLDVMMSVTSDGEIPVPLPADFGADVLYVKDAARLLVSLADFPGVLAPVYNAPSFSLRFSEFVQRLADKSGQAVTVPNPHAVDKSRSWRTLSDAMLREDTNFEPGFDAVAMINDWLDEAAQGTGKA